MYLHDSLAWPGWKWLSAGLLVGMLTKIVVSGVMLAPKGVLPWIGPKVSEAATPVSPKSEKMPAVPHLLSLVEKERRTLQARESSLTAKEEQLNVLKKEVEDRLRELKSMQIQLLEFMEEEKRIKGEQNRHLVSTLESMPPDRAGKLMEKMDEELAAQLLRRLKGKEAGAIMALLPPDKAARLSQRLIKTAGAQ